MAVAVIPKPSESSARIRGIELYLDGKFAEALQFLEDAYKDGDENKDDTGVFLGWTLAQVFQLNAAKELFKKILDRAPDTSGAADGYCFTLKSLGLEPEAIRIARRELDRGILQFAIQLCGLLIETGNLKDAKDHIKYLKQIIAERPNASDPFSIHYVLGELYAGLKDWKQSILHYRNSIDSKNPTYHTIVQSLRACSYTNQVTNLEQTFEFCKKFTDIDLLPIWTRYQLARFKVCANVRQTFKEEPEQPIKADHAFKSYINFQINRSRRLWDQNDILAAKDNFKSPVINPDSLHQNIKAFRSLASHLIKNNTFEVWQKNFKAFKKDFGVSVWQPVNVISTGRCGTESLFNLLNQSKIADAHHSFAIRLAPMDRNHLLYRIIEGNFDETTVKSILINYLESRSAEYLYTIRQNKTFVTVNHYDSIMAPFCAELFPESRFIYLARDEEATFKSFYGKNQWRNRQLQHWLYDPSFPKGHFVYCQDETLSMEAHISWYFYITKVFAKCFFKTLPEYRHISLRSEKLFAMDESEFSKLRSVLPEGTISEEAIRNTYTNPRNTKTAFIHLANKDIEERSTYVKEHMKTLEHTGTL